MFIDIKTAIGDLSTLQEEFLARTVEDVEGYLGSKAMYKLEYNQIVCCTLAYITNEKIVLKQLEGKEEDILNSLLPLIEKRYLVGHNIKQFIIPTIRIKLMKYGIKVPYYIDERGLKPWEIGTESSAKLLAIDSLDFIIGNYSHYMSLHSCCLAMGVPFTQYGGNTLEESKSDILSLINLYYIAARKDHSKLSIDNGTTVGVLDESPVNTLKKVINKIYNTKLISFEDVALFKDVCSGMEESEKSIAKEILQAVSKNTGHKDYFYGGDDEETENFKLEIIKTID